MNTIRALIVDDERPGRERLRRLLAKEPGVELAGSCAGGAEALELVYQAAAQKRDVQLIFLDVQMPEMDGFAVASALVSRFKPENVPAIVFVTAHEQYALRAFEAHAIDYLLKPFSDERFQAALDRASRHVGAGDAQTVIAQMRALIDRIAQGELPDQATAQRTGDRVDKLAVRGSHRVRLLPVEQITWIEADGMYVKLHTREGEVHLHRGLLGSLDASLDQRRFVRIHRSTVVNIDVVTELQQDAHGDYVAVLRDRTELRVGRRFLPRLEARLGQVL